MKGVESSVNLWALYKTMVVGLLLVHSMRRAVCRDDS